jgi:hypothetical protein
MKLISPNGPAWTARTILRRLERVNGSPIHSIAPRVLTSHHPPSITAQNLQSWPKPLHWGNLIAPDKPIAS